MHLHLFIFWRLLEDAPLSLVRERTQLISQLQVLLLRCRLRCDRFKAGGRQHAFFILRAGLCRGAADAQHCARNGYNG